MPVQRLDALGTWYDISRSRVGKSSSFALPSVTTTAPTTDPTIRPTGSDYVTIESLMLPGDIQSDGTADWTAIMRRNQAGTTGKILTFPEGVFSTRDFQDDASTYQAAILPPKWVRGIIGSGKGTLGGTTGTIFTMKPMSSTRGNGATYVQGGVTLKYVPDQGTSQPVQLNVFKHYPQYPPVYKNFQVAGTAQGHIFSLMQSYGLPSGGLAEDLLLTGWEGDNGAPPGETSALGLNGGPNGSTGHIMRRVDVDGRRTPGGQVFGAMGLTFQNAAGCLFDSCTIRYCRAACAVFYQTFSSELRDCVIDSVSAGTYALGNGGVNMERSSKILLTRPTIIGRSGKVHITHSNDFLTKVIDGVQYSAAGGSLEIVDATYNDALGNGYLAVQSWIPYSVGPSTVIGNSMTYPGAVAPDGTSADGPSTAPWMHKGNGTSDPRLLWIFDKRYVNPIPHHSLVA